MIGGSFSGPGDDAVRSYKPSAQTQPLPCVACDIGDPVAPAAGKGLKRWARVEVLQQAFSLPEEFAGPRSVGQFEVRNAAAQQRVSAAEIVAQRNTPHALGK